MAGAIQIDVGGRFVGIGKALERLQHIRLDLALRPLDGEVAQVLGCAKSTGYQQAAIIYRIQLGQIFYLATADSGSFDQHVAALPLAHFTGQVVDDMELLDVRSEALYGSTLTCQCQQADDGFMNFCPVKDAQPLKITATLFHGKLLVVENVS